MRWCKWILLGVIACLALSACGAESPPVLHVNAEMQAELENRTPGSVTWIENEISPCNTHPSTKWIRSEHTHQTTCVRCGEIVVPPEAHQIHSHRYEGYTIINGEIYLRCDARCRCGFLMEHRYVPYDVPKNEEVGQ